MNTVIFLIRSAGYCACVDKKNMIIVISLYFTPLSSPQQADRSLPPVAVWELNSISQSWAETRAIPHNKTRWKERRKCHVQLPLVSERWQITFLNSHRQTITNIHQGAMLNRRHLKFPFWSFKISIDIFGTIVHFRARPHHKPWIVFKFDQWILPPVVN